VTTPAAFCKNPVWLLTALAIHSPTATTTTAASIIMPFF